MKRKQPDQNLPEAANQKALEEKVREILGPAPHEATTEEIQAIRGGEASVSEPTGAPELTSPAPSPGPKLTQPDIREDVTMVEAVDDIVKEESDTILKTEDEALAKAFEPDKKLTFAQKAREFFKKWWANPRARWGTIIAAFVVLAVSLAVPASRYFLLNSLGIRSSASLVVLDETTQLPLRNVSVTLGGQTAFSDGEGKVKLEKVRLGRSLLMVEKRAFAPVSRSVTVGWGSNPLGGISLIVVGQQYSFVAKDFLSGKAVGGVEAISGDASALADKDGRILLAVDTSDIDTLAVTITAPGYRDETIEFNTSETANKNVSMVPSRKVLFVSKRSGTYDLYKIDADGKNEKLVLEGTGVERDDISLVPHPSDEVAALVSTRENERDREGFLLSTLTLVNVTTGEPTKVAQSQRIQLVGWFDDYLVFVQVADGTSASNPKRHRLVSYDYKTAKTKELAASNSFNDVMAIGDKIYFAPSYTFQPKAKPGFFRVDADGNNQEIVTGYEVWNIFRTGYDTLTLSSQNLWSEYSLASGSSQRLNGQPGTLVNRIYIDNLARTHSLWTDMRDGKGILLNYDASEKTDKKIIERSGLTNPIRWLSDTTAVFRIRTADETADYVMNLEGGEPKKIIDVTHTSGIDRWYYY